MSNAKRFFFALSPLLLTGMAAAQYSSYSTSTDIFATLFGGGLGVVGIICWCIAIIVNLVGVIFWIMMIIDVAKRTEVELPNRTMWLLIVILLGWIGALVYYFSDRKKLAKK